MSSMPESSVQSVPGAKSRHVEIDGALYGESVVFRVCHLFTDRCTVSLERLDSSRLRVMFEAPDNALLDQTIRQFTNELINQRVRADVEAETRKIRELIVAQAFAEADAPRTA